MRYPASIPQLPQLLGRLPWLVAVVALWGLVQVPAAAPQTGSERVGGRALAGPIQPSSERDLRGDPHPSAPRVWRETPPPTPWPDLPPAPPQPVRLLVRQYAAGVAGAAAQRSVRVRAARFGKWQLEGG